MTSTRAKLPGCSLEDIYSFKREWFWQIPSKFFLVTRIQLSKGQTSSILSFVRKAYITFDSKSIQYTLFQWSHKNCKVTKLWKMVCLGCFSLTCSTNNSVRRNENATFVLQISSSARLRSNHCSKYSRKRFKM